MYIKGFIPKIETKGKDKMIVSMGNLFGSLFEQPSRYRESQFVPKYQLSSN